MAFQADKVIAVRTRKIIYRDGNTVIKVFDQNYLKSSVLNEALNHARIEETGLRWRHDAFLWCHKGSR